ncbi:MAG: hypothetical protein IPH26_18685 [Sterolibacteriaceae bacterium]|uniref:O-antigen ligase domain-containing protein n=1 Tax=Candidatus Methylophosphatis roskildensis TaxID=2899263 RepID=A0A9D7E6N9_9PROT|nr:hypothetical protein [Candidatus Methylophosphatis roskildensis]MBK7237462.1 hypothetical protein [Sterolibacteriaceae bacterium]
MIAPSYRAGRQPTPFLLIALIVFALLTVLLAGLLIGSAQWVWLGGLLLLGVVLPGLIYVGTLHVEDRRGRLLLFGWIVMLTAHGLHSRIGLPVGYVLELVLFPLAWASTRSVLSRAATDRTLRLFVALVTLYFAIALLSSALGRSHAIAALWQLQYNLKWPLMFGLGTLVAWSERSDDLLRKLIAWSWLAIVPFLVLEVVSLSLHTRIFELNPDMSGNPLLGVGRRYRGPFFHAGYMAIVCGLLAAGAFSQWLAGRGVRWALLTFLYLVFVLASGQRQEFAALILVLVLLLAIMWRRYWAIFALSGLVFGVLTVAGLVYVEHVPMRDTLAQWGLFDDYRPLSERAILSRAGIVIAEQYFPLGSGLGTYGGAGAQKFDLSLFWDLGFGRNWWFRQGLFIVDTYWPCVIAESGFIGALSVAVALVTMWFALLRRAWFAVATPSFFVAFVGLAALTLLVANTPSSAVITDPRGSFVFWLLIGAAWRANGPPDLTNRIRTVRRDYASNVPQRRSAD